MVQYCNPPNQLTLKVVQIIVIKDLPIRFVFVHFTNYISVVVAVWWLVSLPTTIFISQQTREIGPLLFLF